MKKTMLLMLLAGTVEAASLVNVPALMKKNNIPITLKNGIKWATISEPHSGEQVAIGIYGDAAPGKASRSISLLYEGFSFNGGMYGLGYLTSALSESCLGQSLNAAEDAAVFVQNSTQQALRNGSGTFSKTFGRLRYTVKASSYANGRMRVLLTTSAPTTNEARCSF